MFRISFGQRLVMIIAYVLLPVVSQPLTTLPKTAPPQPSATSPPQPSEAPPRPTATAPPQSTDSPQPSATAPPRPSATSPPQPREAPPPPSKASPQPSATVPPQPREAPPQPSATAPPQPREAPPRPSATDPPPPSEAPPIPPSVPVLRVWPDHPSPGQTIKVDGEGRWPTGEMITVSLVISDEVNKVVSSDTVHVGDNGTFTAFVTVPKDVEPGTPAIVDAVGNVSNQVFITIGGEV